MIDPLRARYCKPHSDVHPPAVHCLADCLLPFLRYRPIFCIARMKVLSNITSEATKRLDETRAIRFLLRATTVDLHGEDDKCLMGMEVGRVVVASSSSAAAGGSGIRDTRGEMGLVLRQHECVAAGVTSLVLDQQLRLAKGGGALDGAVHLKPVLAESMLRTLRGGGGRRIQRCFRKLDLPRES